MSDPSLPPAAPLLFPQDWCELAALLYSALEGNKGDLPVVLDYLPLDLGRVGHGQAGS